jgi:hypothetical protein
VAQAGPDSWKLVRRDGGAHPAAADEHTALSSAFHNGPANGLREVGIVAGLGAISAEVQDIVAERPQMLGEHLFQLEPGMIGP